MYRSAIAIIALMLVSISVAGVTKQGCAVEGGIVEPSKRGANWWKCCLNVPSGILRDGISKICYICKGESPESNCDQIAYEAKDKKKTMGQPATQDEKKTK